MTTFLLCSVCLLILNVLDRYLGADDYGPNDEPQDLSQWPADAGRESEVGGINVAPNAE